MSLTRDVAHQRCARHPLHFSLAQACCAGLFDAFMQTLTVFDNPSQHQFGLRTRVVAGHEVLQLAFGARLQAVSCAISDPDRHHPAHEQSKRRQQNKASGFCLGARLVVVTRRAPEALRLNVGLAHDIGVKRCAKGPGAARLPDSALNPSGWGTSCESTGGATKSVVSVPPRCRALLTLAPPSAASNTSRLASSRTRAASRGLLRWIKRASG